MCWKTVRLELAPGPGFPKGSASRGYLLHLPLDEQGRVEEQEFARAPALATVRRHWPNERDRVGRVVRGRDGWSFSYACAEAVAGGLGAERLRPGRCVAVTEPDGRRLKYRVM